MPSGLLGARRARRSGRRSIWARLPGKSACRLRSATVPEVRIDAEPRTEFGKGPARRARRVGKVPAVLYGHGTETRHVTVPGHDVLLALRTPNVLIRLDGLPGGSELALPKAVQRDAIRGTVEHVDLLLVRHGEKVTVDIPVQVTGEVVPDALLDQQLVQVTVEAEATNIPPGVEVNIDGLGIGSPGQASHAKLATGRSLTAQPEATNVPPGVEVNIDGLGIGSAVHASDLKLPRGVSLAVEPDTLILHVVAMATAEQFEAELGVPEGEAAEAPAGGAEPAPAPAPEGEQEAAGGDQPA